MGNKGSTPAAVEKAAEAAVEKVEVLSNKSIDALREDMVARRKTASKELTGLRAELRGLKGKDTEKVNAKINDVERLLADYISRINAQIEEIRQAERKGKDDARTAAAAARTAAAAAARTAAATEREAVRTQQKTERNQKRAEGNAARAAKKEEFDKFMAKRKECMDNVREMYARINPIKARYLAYQQISEEIDDYPDMFDNQSIESRFDPMLEVRLTQCQLESHVYGLEFASNFQEAELDIKKEDEEYLTAKFDKSKNDYINDLKDKILKKKETAGGGRMPKRRGTRRRAMRPKRGTKRRA
jgi:hypothetical protein